MTEEELLKLKLAKLLAELEEKKQKEKEPEFDLIGAPFDLVRGTCDVAEKFIKSILPF